MEASNERVSVEHLASVYFRAEDEQGKWGTVDALNATDKQFHEWATSRMKVEGEILPWSLPERADFCTILHQQGTLYFVKK